MTQKWKVGEKSFQLLEDWPRRSDIGGTEITGRRAWRKGENRPTPATAVQHCTHEGHDTLLRALGSDGKQVTCQGIRMALIVSSVVLGTQEDNEGIAEMVEEISLI